MGASVLVWLIACSGPKAADTSPHDSADPTVAPVVTAVTSVTCAVLESAGETWNMALTVDDPQGANTVNGGSVNVLDTSQHALASYALACDNGACAGTFRASYDNIGCSLEGSVTLEFVVTDADGHLSEPFEYPT